MQNNLENDLNKTKKLYHDIFEKSQKALEVKLSTLGSKELKLEFLQKEVCADILKKITLIRKRLDNFKCSHCATCCKLACSEFSPQELKEKARNGDKFAKDFTSVFIPYEDKNKLPDDFSDYIALLKKEGLFENSYFYYCPKLKYKDDSYSCSDYDNRPNVCRDFPNNPLVILPPKCGFRPWKDENEIEALFLNAMLELSGFYIQELKKDNTQD